MSGIISARAWGKVWAYRSTFLLGLLNTVDDSIFCDPVIAGTGCDLWPDGYQRKKGIADHQQSLCGDHAEYTDFASAVFLLLCVWLFPVTVSESCRQVSLHWAYTPEYMAEVVRAGIEAVPKGQFEAAVSQGFTYVERMYYIILPRASRSFCRHGEPDRKPDQKYLLPVYYRRSGSDIADLQLCHR